MIVMPGNGANAVHVTGWGYREKWFDAVADNITNSIYFQRNGGRDHVHVFTWYYLKITSKLRTVPPTVLPCNL